VTDLGSPAGGVAATVHAIGERALIARITARLARPAWAVVGPGDDAAVLEPPRGALDVLTTDAFVEGVHFDRRFCPPDAIGHKALAVNLSDLAAMGAAPRLCLLSLALPPAWPVDEFDQMIGGFTALAARHGVHVAGGNLTRSPGPLVLDVTVLGGVKRRQALTRGGARPGDELYVTGSLGAAAAGLEMLRLSADASGECTRRYLFPEPRLGTGLLLGRNRAASACIDLSDGLADGVHHIADRSGVGAIIDAEALPIEPAARTWFDAHAVDPATAAITGGDDYELLFTVRPRTRGRLKAAGRNGGTPLTRIGVCTADRAVVLRCAAGARAGDRPIPAGYSHFR
jgi:thiamine-monophosphate kinase